MRERLRRPDAVFGRRAGGRPRARGVVGLLAGLSLVLAGCGAARSGEQAGSSPLRIGYFLNVTHAPAVLGVAGGGFSGIPGGFRAQSFVAGPELMEALLAGRVDVAYVGPIPAVNAFLRSGGALRIVAGSTSGGALLVARRGVQVRGPADLAGLRVATPQLGNTQDVALRWLLRGAGLAPVERGGDVRIVPLPPAQAAPLFERGELDAAWVPEPWASYLVHAVGARVVLDERELWPGGRFATAVVVAGRAALAERREQVAAFVAAHARLVERLRSDPAARAEVATLLSRLTGRPLPEPVWATAWQHLEFTTDPLVDSIRTMAGRSYRLGFLPAPPPPAEALLDPSLLPGP